MRFALIVVAALVSLGLAAFGVVSAQKIAARDSANGPVVRLASNANTLPTRTPVQPAQPVQPVQQIAEARAPETAPATPAPSSPVATQPGSSATPSAAATPTTQLASPAQNPQNGQPQTTPVQKTAAAPAAASDTKAPMNTIPACDKPGGMGLSRVVEIDTTGGPGFGFEHFKQYDFLRDKEVVLTFDDGPWPENTLAVLKALVDNCLKATFFEIGEHAMWHPQITKQVIEAGMTVGSHTWSHKDLARNPYASDLDLAKQEIEMGVSAVHAAADAPIAPFFRFPDLQHPPELLAYLAERNIATFSTDIDSFDFKLHKPDQVIKSVMTKLEKHGKGIILMHDFQRATAEAMPELLRQLKAGGYKVVHLVPHQMVTTLAKYDEMVKQQDKLSTNNTRPENSVIHTIGEYVGSPPPPSAAHE
jgi:peptidoglycan/xylan/chitin deacetylase (PgdA/CDA1 family)